MSATSERAAEETAETSRPSLGKNKIGVLGVVVLVIACASPLAALVGNMPLGFVLGDGVGMPGAFVISGILLAFFAVGFVTLAPHVKNAAAFYAYVGAGLGERAGRAAALIAALGYNTLAAGLIGFVGYFGNSVVLSLLHVSLPWQLFAAIGLVLAVALSIAGVDAGVKLLIVLLAAEGIFIVAATVITFASHGQNIGVEPFLPANILAGAPGVALMFALISYIGFEATAVFAEEARDSAKTVRRATLISVIAIAVIYSIVAWSAVVYYGPEKVASVDPATFYTAVVIGALGPWSEYAIGVLLLTSLFATLLAVHNMAARYLFGMSRAGMFPVILSRTSRRGAPWIACIAQAAIVAIVAAVYSITGQDPYLNLATTMFGIGTIAIVTVQVLAGVSVIVFFRRKAAPPSGLFASLIAPFIGSAGLLIACIMVVLNFSLLTASTSPIINSLYLLVPIAALVGIFLPAKREITTEAM
jgi:amino acid transporter